MLFKRACTLVCKFELRGYKPTPKTYTQGHVHTHVAATTTTSSGSEYQQGTPFLKSFYSLAISATSFGNDWFPLGI